MSIERTYYCDWSECGEGTPVHVSTATPPPYLPESIIEVRIVEPNKDIKLYFCGWDCLMKYSAQQPIPERIEMGDL